MSKIEKLISKCQTSDSAVISVVLRHLYYRILGKNILANNRVIIKGIENINTDGLLEIGVTNVGFMHRYDRTFLNIKGKLHIRGNFSIGKGCRFDVSDGAIAEFGNGYVNADSKFIVMHRLIVGDGCAISWGCLFLDDDFHEISYLGKIQKHPTIEIGRKVWIGSNVIVLKGSRIPDGCVVASGSLVSSMFDKANCLIAGNPARVIKENVTWN